MDTGDFLRAFFGEGNRFDYDSLVSSSTETHRAVRRWAEALEEDRSAVLPRWEEDGVTWYGVATTEGAMRGLIEQVEAFIGPSLSTFAGERARLDEDDPIERAVQNYTGGRALRFHGKDNAIRTRLDQMHEVRMQRQPHTTEEDLGTGIVLRRFNMALAAGDRPEAEKQIQYLRERGLLDPTNIRYLQIRMRAAFEAWEEIVQFEEISDLIESTSHPLPVRRALLQAVYHTHFDSYEGQGAPEEALEHYEETVQPEYGPLFTVRSSMQVPEVLKAFMMKAVSGEETNEDLRDELMKVAERIELNDSFFEALTELGSDAGEPTVVENPISEAMTAWSEGDVDAAFRMLRQAESSPRKSQCLALIHGDLQSLDVEQELEATLADLPAEEQKELARRHPICQQVFESASAPSSWRHWLSHVRGEGYDSQEKALQHAEKLVEEWHPQQVLDAEGALEELVHQVETAPLDGWGGRIVSLALPRLLESLQNDSEYPRSTFQSLYGAVLNRIPYASDLTKSDLDVYRDLAEVRLGYGVGEDAYREILDGAETLWKEAGSAGRVDWLLDFAELLVLAPSQDEEAQLRFLSSVAQAIQKYRGRIEPIQIDLFCSLCDEVKQSEIAGQVGGSVEQNKEDESGDELCRILSGRTLGIYTLTESAGRRVKAFLESRCGGVTVKLRHDKKGSAELHRVAENADYFLVVTRSATHAATDVIEQHVPTSRLIYPRGKGESSMLRDLAETLGQEE
jgi:transcription antitermination factor NusG